MKFNHLKYLLFFFTLLYTGRTFSQPPDTIVIIEYIYKTDTVWMEPRPVQDTTIVEKWRRIEEATLVLDTIDHQTNLIYFSSGRSATIPINHILYNENHIKISNMKKVSFFSLLFLAIQSISYAQPDISVKAGISQYWDKLIANTDDGLWLGDHVGFEMKGPLAKKNFSFSVGYDYHSFINDLNITLFDTSGTYTAESSKLMKTYHSFPFLIYYKIKKVELFAGYEFRSVRTDVASDFSDGQLYNSFYFKHEHALSAGIEYKITNRLSVLGKYCTGGIYVSALDDRLKNNGGRLDLSLKYYLYRNPSFLSIN